MIMHISAAKYVFDEIVNNWFVRCVEVCTWSPSPHERVCIRFWSLQHAHFVSGEHAARCKGIFDVGRAYNRQWLVCVDIDRTECGSWMFTTNVGVLLAGGFTTSNSKSDSLRSAYDNTFDPWGSPCTCSTLGVYYVRRNPLLGNYLHTHSVWWLTDAVCHTNISIPGRNLMHQC